MFKILGENYYLDLNVLDNEISIEKPSNSDDEIEEGHNVNLVKFELLKLMVEVVLSEREDIDENLGAYSSKDLSIPFRIAFNTLLKHNILKSL